MCFSKRKSTSSLIVDLSIVLCACFNNYQVLDKPLELKLEDLLERQQKSETVLDLEHVGLSVNLLIHFLNSKFMAKD